MQSTSLQSFSEKYRKLLDDEMIVQVESLSIPQVLKDSMLYSLRAGGKRIRPLLLFATLAAFGDKPEKGLIPASALEMIHTYSLIHDDLPSMDNDDLRRGKPTNHKVFGEANAILAGDALLTYSFFLLSRINDNEVTADQKVKLIEELAYASGAEGMVGGQVADIEGEGKKLSMEQLEYIHKHKTGRLLIASVLMGCILSEAKEEQMAQLAEFAHHLGIAFQIKDDILDIEGTEEAIGKPIGSDSANDKNTYPSLLTLEGAKQRLEMHISEAKQILADSKLQTFLLEEITDLIATRNH